MIRPGAALPQLKPIGVCEMGVGKYSPTVTVAYLRDQEWHSRLQTEMDWYDDEGYDNYGYHRDTKLDRAGHTENDYLSCGEWIEEEYCYPLYDNILNQWAYDGTRPVKRK